MIMSELYSWVSFVLRQKMASFMKLDQPKMLNCGQKWCQSQNTETLVLLKNLYISRNIWIIIGKCQTVDLEPGMIPLSVTFFCYQTCKIITHNKNSRLYRVWPMKQFGFCLILHFRRVKPFKTFKDLRMDNLYHIILILTTKQ